MSSYSGANFMQCGHAGEKISKINFFVLLKNNLRFFISFISGIVLFEWKGS